MKIVDSKQIPSIDQIKDVLLDNLAETIPLCKELQELCLAEEGLGLSAVQAGIPLKLFIIRGDGSCPLIPKDRFGWFANCSYVPVIEDEVISLEGCLSLRSEDGRLRSFRVKRLQQVLVKGFVYLENEFKQFEIQLGLDQQGIVFQHEIDHNFGHDKLISVIGNEFILF